MADEADNASYTYDEHCDNSVARVRTAAAKIPTGKAGTCEICDGYFTRVVSVFYIDGRVFACGHCRDRFKLG
jgi:predicted SprT family Zn-dependent metalloprotease